MITPIEDVKMANDKYRATLRSTWISSPADTSLLVTAIPANLPTYITVGWNTDLETVFEVTGSSGDSPSNYALTGATRIKGANENLPEGTAVNCLNHEEFFNQYEEAINSIVEETNDALVIVDSLDEVINGYFIEVADATSMEFDLNNGANRKFKCTLGGNRTFTVANGRNGTPFVTRITMDGTAREVTWFTGYDITWQGTTGATDEDIAASKTGTYGFMIVDDDAMDGFFLGAEE